MKQQAFFNRYTFNTRTDKLGGGAFGSVYKAYDNVLDKYVAIKIAEVKQVGDKEFSLLDEFAALKDLPLHKNIANYEEVHTFEQQNGVFDYAVIQYYPHGNLKTLNKQSNLTFSEREQIAIQLLEGISFLHQHKVIHRDIKPSNILIHKRTNGEIVPKIADFGLSKKADLDQSRITNSFGGGTLEYSSPEQLTGKPIQLNADLWAYGVVVYELLTKKRLFQSNSNGNSESEHQIHNQILSKDVTEQIQELPQNWKVVIGSCLEKEVKKRAKSAPELLKILKQDKHEEDEQTIVTNVVRQPNTNTTETKVVAKQRTPKNYSNKYQEQKSAPILLFVILGIAVFGLGFWFIQSAQKNTKQNVVHPNQIIEKKNTKNQEEPKINFSQLMSKTLQNQFRQVGEKDYQWTEEQAKEVKQMQKINNNYPYLAKGDFNADKLQDIAFQVIDVNTLEKKILIYTPSTGYYFFPNIRQVRMFDAISTEHQSKVYNTKENYFIDMEADGILVESFSETSYLIYWSGNQYLVTPFEN